MNELELSQRVRDYFRSLAPEVKAIRIAQSQYSGTTGTSDWLLCIKGNFVALELKIGDNKPTKKQDLFLREIIDAGGISLVCYSLDEVQKKIESLLYYGPAI